MRVGCVRSAAVSLLVVLAAFPAPGQAPGSARVPDRSRATPRLFNDVLGHSVEWARPPERIVSLSPNVTEILFAIECGEHVVGVTRFCNHPPETSGLPRVGGVVDPSLEAVIELSPELVLATRGNSLEFIESLMELGIPVFALDSRGNLEQILIMIGEIGSVTGHSREAGALVRRLREKRMEVLRRTRDLPALARPRVYYGELEGSLWTAGPGSYIDALITDAGGWNVAAGAPRAWCAVSVESVVMQDPEVYLGTYGRGGPGVGIGVGETWDAREVADSESIALADTSDASAPGPGAGARPARSDSAGPAASPAASPEKAEAAVRDLLLLHPVWSETTLGKNPRVFLVDEDRLLRPGPRVFDVLEEFSRFLHPGSWK